MLQEDISKTNDSFERYKERLSNFSGEFEFGLFLFIAKKSLIWVVLLITLAFSAAYIYLRYTSPVYQSSSTIQIQPSNQAQANKLLNVGNFETESGLAEGVELLRSKVFLKRVLSKLPLQVSYYSEGTFRANELYTGSPYTIEVKVKNPVIQGTKFYIDFNNNRQGTLNFKFANNTYSKNYEVDHWLEFPQIDIKINIRDFSEIEKQQNLVKKNAFYFTVNDTNTLVNSYFSNVDVKLLNSEAKTIFISFKDNNPQKAADLVTAMTGEYTKFDVERQEKSSKNIIDFIDQQLADVYEDLKLSEDNIQDFKRSNDIDENDKGGDNIELSKMTRRNSIEDQIISFELEENVLDKLEVKINKLEGIDTYSLVAMLAGASKEPDLALAVEDLHKLLIQKEELLYDVKLNSEAVKQVEFQITIQKNFLKESIKSVKNNIETRKEGLQMKAKELEDKTKAPQNEIEYNRLQRLFSINEKYYTLLLEKKTEYSISKAGFVSQSVVLEQATASKQPVAPDRNTIYLIYILVAVILSLILILIRYLSHNEINSLNEITKYTHASISILGIVPKCRQDIPVSQLLIDKNPKSLVAESFRSIRTNLQFISNEPGPKVIAITSTVSGEGKTFVAINLAGIIAYSGKKVVIIDLDMRKPKIHLGFNAQNTIGMSTVLIGKDSVENAIKHSSLEYLDFITAGPIPPNPSELIINPKMTEILEHLKTMYDVIIIDNPPVGLVSDGIAMIQKADYPIYIFRADYSKRNFIQNIDRLYNEANIKRLSVVLNGVDVERKQYGYNYGYGYGYGYGSGYGYYEEDAKSKSNRKKSFFKK